MGPSDPTAGWKGSSPNPGGEGPLGLGATAQHRPLGTQTHGDGCTEGLGTLGFGDGVGVWSGLRH